MPRTTRVVGMVLAGGQGKRLHPLTARRSKPAVPFGAKYRIIDFILNNLLNSGIYSIYVLTQFRAQSLTEHIQRFWRFGTFLDDHFIILVPAQMYRYEELGPVWYRGTADAIYQNVHLLENHKPDVVAVFGGDHIFKMNVAHMVGLHLDSGADITIAGYPVHLAEATRFGVMQVDDSWALKEFQEKPENPKPIPGRPNQALVSMGNYLFKSEVLRALLEEDAQDPSSSHDFGKDLLPTALSRGHKIQVYNFHDNPIPGAPLPNHYWRDVGTIDAYYEANMDLVQIVPEFDLINPEWPLRAPSFASPPAKFVHESAGRTGRAYNSLVGEGVIISGSEVRESVLFNRDRIHSYALVERSILFSGVEIGRHSRVRRAIIDKDVVIPSHMSIGYDHEEDRGRGFTVSEGGVVVVPKGYKFGA
ncbi:MAG: glucose-1-phosphate adenylyltransferase [Deltaproteobacteria bacterium]|nr:glucose-1-phosphate adenylyltransferase [Deltaproteobacteria bacterium]